MNNITINKWKLNREEVGYYVGQGESSKVSDIKVYIPKILPMIKKESASYRRKPLFKSGIINSSECKISISPSVLTQNFIEVPRRESVTFERPLLKSNTKFMIEYDESDIDSGRITNIIDNSVYKKKVKTV